ncbi:hypothetical protein NFX31_12780 [Microbacterium azadirachtae]|uniref:DUF7882 family protein n=1 Tax=Microbacterium azadirachtae TaxID=582680 RepID=UPI0021D491D7|nr:hypothetical protein [Microbacterium azadirachtae]UXW85085.1 hypothetical protein NFX31_12780 [Microbacterium azadirachtae]
MGILYYGSAEHPVEIDDTALAHLKVVVATKLRRNESFTLSWKHDDGEPVGRSTIWLHPSIPLRFEFNEPDPPELDPARIQAYAESANTSGGILIPEDHIRGSRGTSTAP